MNGFDEKELMRIWKRYVDGRFVYRAQSDEFTGFTLKNGLIPGRCPYSKIRFKVEKLFKWVELLEKKGYEMVLDWDGYYPKGSEAVLVSREDMDGNFIDFTLSYKEALDFKRRFRGGALTSNVLQMIEKIRGLDIRLTKSREDLLRKLEAWSFEKSKYKSVIVRVRCSSKVLGKARFQNFSCSERYWESPFGSFENFRRVAQKYGIERYMDYFEGKRNAHVRVVGRISGAEVEVLGRRKNK